MNKVVKKIFNVIIDIVVILILMVSVLVVMLSLTSKSSGIANILGYAPLSVQSNSMYDTFSEGDLIVCEVVTKDTKIEVGDVVTFPIEIENETYLNTHRVTEIFKDNDIDYYRTKGDYNAEEDEELQSAATIKAKWTDVVIPGVGGFLTFLRTQLGFFLCILLPMILFFVYEGIRVIMNIMAYNKEKAIEDARKVVEGSELTEEQKQQAIAEYLAMQGVKLDEEKSADENPAEEQADSSVQTPADSTDSGSGE